MLTCIVKEIDGDGYIHAASYSRIRACTLPPQDTKLDDSQSVSHILCIRVVVD